MLLGPPSGGRAISYFWVTIQGGRATSRPPTSLAVATRAARPIEWPALAGGPRGPLWQGMVAARLFACFVITSEVWHCQIALSSINCRRGPLLSTFDSGASPAPGTARVVQSLRSQSWRGFAPLPGIRRPLARHCRHCLHRAPARERLHGRGRQDGRSRSPVDSCGGRRSQPPPAASRSTQGHAPSPTRQLGTDRQPPVVDFDRDLLPELESGPPQSLAAQPQLGHLSVCSGSDRRRWRDVRPEAAPPPSGSRVLARAGSAAGRLSRARPRTGGGRRRWPACGWRRKCAGPSR